MFADLGEVWVPSDCLQLAYLPFLDLSLVRLSGRMQGLGDRVSWLRGRVDPSGHAPNAPPQCRTTSIHHSGTRIFLTFVKRTAIAYHTKL
jgi:hypothetical protein